MTATTPPRDGPAFYPGPDLWNHLEGKMGAWRMTQWLRGLGDQLDALSQDPNQPPDFYPLGAWTAEKLRDVLVGLRQQNEANAGHPAEPWSLLPDMERISASLRQRADALDPDAS